MAGEDKILLFFITDSDKMHNHKNCLPVCSLGWINSEKPIFLARYRLIMDFDEKDKQIQKKINWISAKIRDTKFQLHQEYKELKDAIDEQEKLRKSKKPSA